MKRNFLRVSLAALAVLTLATSADARKWDFRKWSAETVANLMTGSNWSDVEKATATEPTEVAKDNCFWQVKAADDLTEDKYVMANGEVIKELEGLVYTNTTDRSLAIAVNYKEADAASSFGPYNGPSYLWFGGSKKNYFIIPQVKPGTIIRMGVESHKITDARGVELYVGAGTSGAKLTDPDGNAVATPTTYQDQAWMVPADLEEEAVDIQLYNTNGCHIYYITVEGENDGPVVEEAKKVAYIANDEASQGFDEIQNELGANTDRIEMEVIQSSEVSSLEELQAYQAVVVSPFVAATDAIVPTLKSAIAYQPMVNLNADLLKAWDLGEVGTTDATSAQINALYAESDLFAEMEIEDSELPLLVDGTLPALLLGDYFAKDQVIAAAGDAVVMHQHNASRNTYIGLGLTADLMNAMAVNPDAYKLAVNAAVVAANTKMDVTKAVKPNISYELGDKKTTVKISASKDAVVYYTVDGSEPTAESAVYADPFVLTAEATVKAFATLDGYLPSDVASADIKIATQAAAPEVVLEKADKQTTVTLSCATEGVDIYYSFVENNKVAEVGKYSEPIVLTEPTYIYTFAAGGDYVQSELVSEYVAINGITADNIRLDEVAHFNANQTDWTTNSVEYNYDGTEMTTFHSTGTYYYWYSKENNPDATKNGKVNGWNYYDTNNQIGETEPTEEDPEPKPIYAPDPTSVRTAVSTTDTDWRLFSQGQVLISETNGPSAIVGNGAGGYYADNAKDLIGGAPSKNNLQFGGKVSGDPYSGGIESTKAYTAPFDVVAYCGGTDTSLVNVEVSADGKEWEKVGELNKVTNACSDSKWRYFTRTRLAVEKEGNYYVRLTHVGGGSGVRLFDLILLNNGEKSAQYDPSGVEATSAALEVVASEYFDLNGVRLAAPANGINIVRKTLSDGSVKVSKVVRK